MRGNKEFTSLLLRRNGARDRIIKEAIRVLNGSSTKKEKILQVKEILNEVVK